MFVICQNFVYIYFSRLTLVLSCAMKFESYPHDTQICSMMIESCKLIDARLYERFKNKSNVLFSITYGTGFGIYMEYD